MSDISFTDAFKEAVAEAEVAVQKTEDDGNRLVSCTVDGRCSFARAFKRNADERAGIYNLGIAGATIDAINSFSFTVENTSTQHLTPPEANAAFDAFKQTMEQYGYNCSFTVD